MGSVFTRLDWLHLDHGLTYRVYDSVKVCVRVAEWGVGRTGRLASHSAMVSDQLNGLGRP